MGSFKSTKVFDGYSTVFRQWRADGTHCQFLHGYGVSFRVWFEGELDERNWVWDFGGMKRAKGTIDGMNPKAWMDYMFDHTTIVADDDPYLEQFKEMWKDGIIQLRIIPATGAEQFAKYIYEKLNTFIKKETDGRVKIVQVEFREHEKNTAFYKGDDKTLSKKDMEDYLNQYKSNSKYEF
jgi:6-pyruvoyltetrahydropterin/6-carboxytetrahydropterin synthase